MIGKKLTRNLIRGASLRTTSCSNIRAEVTSGARNMELRQRFFAGHRPAGRQRTEIAVAAEGCFQQLVILAPRDLDCAKALEVVGHELSVEQPEATGPQTCDQMNKGDLGRVSGAMEHALAEE